MLSFQVLHEESEYPWPTPQHMGPSYYMRALLHSFTILCHVTMLAIFEPIFYFSYISVFEESVYRQSVNNYAKWAVSEINKIPQSYITQYLYKLIPKKTIQHQFKIAYDRSITSHASRIVFNQRLANMSIALAACFVLTALGIYAILRCKKIRIQWKRLIASNIVLFLLIGLYEYLFFTVVVARYRIDGKWETDYRVLAYIVNHTHIL